MSLPNKHDDSHSIQSSGTVFIEFQPLGRRGVCLRKDSLLNSAHQLGIGINSICYGSGTCGSCLVQITTGQVSSPTTIEIDLLTAAQLDNGWRLACQTMPKSDCTVTIPVESMNTLQRLQIEGLDVITKPCSVIRIYTINLEPPTLNDPTADADRLLTRLEAQHDIHCNIIDISVLQGLSNQLRLLNWCCQVAVRGDEIIAVLTKDTPPLGLAIDLGTTKIAGYIVNLETGRTLAASGLMNPQIECGEDVITRIGMATHESNGRERLQSLAVDAINELATRLLSDSDNSPSDIVDTVVVGNTAEHHFLIGLPVEQLAHTPFTPAVSYALDVKAKEIGLNAAPGSYIHFLPNIAGFIGADHVAMLMATDAWHKDKATIAIDIGTNTEVSIIANNRIVSVSCASGPAFEGGHIKDGMRAAPGAIERVHITDSLEVQYQTIDNIQPIGICGSGILDALAELHRVGIVTSAGRLYPPNVDTRINNSQHQFVLTKARNKQKERAIVITQKDIRELQLGKAAIRTGIETLIDVAGCSIGDISHIIVAGAFGTYIDIEKAISIGMFPPIPLERFQQVGNAAGAGARLALLSSVKRSEAQQKVEYIEYLELATTPTFTRTFAEATTLGRYQLAHRIGQAEI